ncbi:MAG TPA: MBL fold metallo-hydrolase [Candidatus Pullilachnospira intestinigallinarum]|nr:MBL fold metallo-hydrolase [Candidatus Pullilachnospira intestinigallinarum]
MSVEITVLAENTAGEGLAAEHGLSFWIRYEGHSFLLDAGSTAVFAENADRLGIHVEEAEFAVLSHGHYDHGGGLAEWFRRNPAGKVYAREEAFGEYYSLTSGSPRFIGLPDPVQAFRERFCFLSGEMQILPGVWVLGHEGPSDGERAVKEKMYEKTGGTLQPDTFAHEQSLVLQTAKGLVILSSCSHGGIDRTIREAARRFPGTPVRAVLGGFHLKGGPGGVGMPFSPQEIRQLGETLRDMEIPEIYTGHCTGEEAFGILKEVLGGRLHRLRAGRRISLPDDL